MPNCPGAKASFGSPQTLSSGRIPASTMIAKIGPILGVRMRCRSRVTNIDSVKPNPERPVSARHAARGHGRRPA